MDYLGDDFDNFKKVSNSFQEHKMTPHSYYHILQQSFGSYLSDFFDDLVSLLPDQTYALTLRFAIIFFCYVYCCCS